MIAGLHSVGTGGTGAITPFRISVAPSDLCLSMYTKLS